MLTALPQSSIGTDNRHASAAALPSGDTTSAAPSRMLLMLPPPLRRPVATPGAPSRHGDDAAPDADGNAISNSHGRARAMTAQTFAPPLHSAAAALLPASAAAAAAADNDGVAPAAGACGAIKSLAAQQQQQQGKIESSNRNPMSDLFASFDAPGF